MRNRRDHWTEAHIRLHYPRALQHQAEKESDWRQAAKKRPSRHPHDSHAQQHHQQPRLYFVLWSLMILSPVHEVLLGKSVWPLPVWLMRQAGRYLPEYKTTREQAGSFWKLCTTPELACEVTLQPIKRFDFNAAIVFSDILVIPFALGQKVRFEEGVGPQLDVLADVGALERDPEIWREKVSFVYETLRLVRNKLDREKALIGFAGGAWTLAVYMLGGRSPVDGLAAKDFARKNPIAFASFLGLLSDAVAVHLSAQLDAGADLVQTFESHAGLLNKQEFSDWVVAPTKRIVDRLRETHPQALVIGFPRGADQDGYEQYAAETGVTAVSLDTAIPLPWAVSALNPRVTLQGNLDPNLLVQGGDELDRAVDRIATEARGHPFIFNLGHGVLPQTPIAHVERMLKRVRAPA